MEGVWAHASTTPYHSDAGSIPDLLHGALVSRVLTGFIQPMRSGQYRIEPYLGQDWESPDKKAQSTRIWVY